MLYNKINLGGFPMRRKTRADLPLVIVTGVFFVIAVALFFFIPVIDNAIAENPSGQGYFPLDLFVAGAQALLSLNFASTKYLLIFGTGCAIAVLLLFWLVALIVKKRPGKLIFWFLYVLMAGTCAVLVSGYALAPCREIAVYGGSTLKQFAFNDLLFQYGDYRLADNIDVAPYIFYNYLALALGYVVLLSIALVGLFSLIGPLCGAIGLLKKAKPAKVKEVKPAPVKVEPVEEPLSKAENDLISYVEYKAGREAREKEYERICRANGIPLPGDEVEEFDEDAYYAETAARLGCLHEQPEPEPEVDPDEEYYKRLAKELPVLHVTKTFHELEMERYYRDIVKELDMFNEKEDDKYDEAVSNLKRRAAEKRAYYARLMEELPCLQHQNDPVEPEVGKKD